MGAVVILKVQLVFEGARLQGLAQVARLKARLEYERLVDGQGARRVRRHALGRDRRGSLGCSITIVQA